MEFYFGEMWWNGYICIESVLFHSFLKDQNISCYLEMQKYWITITYEYSAERTHPRVADESQWAIPDPVRRSLSFFPFLFVARAHSSDKLIIPSLNREYIICASLHSEKCVKLRLMLHPFIPLIRCRVSRAFPSLTRCVCESLTAPIFPICLT